MVTSETIDQRTTIILSPNRSVEWKDMKLWLLFLSLPALIVGISWFLVGVWIILPFVGLELGLLAFFMYRICYQNYRREQIIIDKHLVTVKSGVHTPSQAFRFTRPNCYLTVKKPNKPIENLELSLSNQKLELPIGKFLSPNDREIARKKIVNAGLLECSNNWWKSG